MTLGGQVRSGQVRSGVYIDSTLSKGAVKPVRTTVVARPVVICCGENGCCGGSPDK